MCEMELINENVQKKIGGKKPPYLDKIQIKALQIYKTEPGLFVNILINSPGLFNQMEKANIY